MKKGETSTIEEDMGEVHQELIPIYVQKIDDIYDYVMEQRVLSDQPLQKFNIYIILLIFIISILTYIPVQKIAERNNVVESKLDFVLESFDEYKKSVGVLNGTVCMTCHNTPDMMISDLGSIFTDVEKFKAYVRKGGRTKNGIMMPPIPEETIDNYTLGKIWKTLK